jgi:hypothetical protein
VFSGARVTRSLVLVYRFLSLCTFSFGRTLYIIPISNIFGYGPKIIPETHRAQLVNTYVLLNVSSCYFNFANYLLSFRYSLTFIYSTWYHQQNKKSLKIPNGLSESVNRGRTGQ